MAARRSRLCADRLQHVHAQHGSHVGGFGTQAHRPNRNLQSYFKLRNERGMALHPFLERAIWTRPHNLQQQREVGTMRRMLFAYRLWMLVTVALAGFLPRSAQEFRARPPSDRLDLPRGI